MKNVLVTGGAGFIGSHLCKHLLEDKNNIVFCLDNLSSGSYDNIKDFIDFDENFRFIKSDVTQPIYLSNIDEIYNFACPASPPNYQLDPVHTGMTSVLGAYHVLTLAKECSAKVIQASTSEVYGDPLEHPQFEDYWGNVNPFGKRSCYDEGKRMAETLFHDFADQYGVDIRVVRIFNTYGPNMQIDDGRVISNFITQALQGEYITMYGDGKQTRSFQYIDDLIKGIFLLMNSDLKTPVNIGNPVEYTMNDIAGTILQKTDSTSTIVYKELPSDDPKQRKPSIQLVESLGFKHDFDLDKGLDLTIKYFKDALGM